MLDAVKSRGVTGTPEFSSAPSTAAVQTTASETAASETADATWSNAQRISDSIRDKNKMKDSLSAFRL
ncbi:hypothetical protein Dimus_028029 [Dionaea muscipula]